MRLKAEITMGVCDDLAEKYSPSVATVVYEKGKVKKVKTMALQDFINTLQDAKVEESRGRVGPFPEGLYDLYKTASGYRACIVRKRQVVPRIYKEKAYVIHMPALFFQIYVNTAQQAQTGVKVYAYDDRQPFNDGTQLYRFPFDHVGNDGDVCFGNRIEVKTYMDLEKVITSFIESPNAGHYWGVGTRIVGEEFGSLPMEELLTKLQTKELPIEALIRYKTVGEVL